MRYLLAVILLFLGACVSNTNNDKYLFTELTSLANNGNPEAQYHLGMFYNNGMGTQKDTAKAFELFEKSASSGDPLGNYKLGCYYSGQGKNIVEKDIKKALEYKLVAAKAGYALAQHDVASMYYQNKEIDNAIMWWKKSADQGYPDSIRSLFTIYHEGKVVQKDIISAYMYLKIIERNTGQKHQSEIQKKLIEIESELSQTQLEQAQNLLKNWSAKQTDLTIKAMAGREETKRLVESTTAR